MGGSIESLPEDPKPIGADVDVLDGFEPLWSKSSAGEGITLELNPLPLLILGSPRGLRLFLTPGFLVGLAVFWIGSAGLWELMAKTAGTEAGTLIGLSSMPTDIFSTSPVIFGLVFTLGVQVSSFLYALSHGVGYTLTGRYLAEIELGFGLRAYPSEDPKNSYQQLGTAVVGGLIPSLVGFSGLLILGGPGWSALQISFLLILIGGFFDLLLPVRRNSSAARFWVSLCRVIAGRGRRPLKPTSEPVSRDVLSL